jgi:serine O-acetyltransferase
MIFFDVVKKDLLRYPKQRFGIIFALMRNDGFRYTFWLRACKSSYQFLISRVLLFPFCYCMYRHYTYKFGCQIPFVTEIGEGFFMSHLIGTVINRKALIGKNVNVSHHVTIGQTNRGKRKGVPVIGDGVYIGTGAVIIGNVRIGNNVSIGANAVVVDDVPDNAVVVGIPAKIISYNGAKGYVNRVV